MYARSRYFLPGHWHCLPDACHYTSPFDFGIVIFALDLHFFSKRASVRYITDRRLKYFCNEFHTKMAKALLKVYERNLLELDEAEMMRLLHKFPSVHKWLNHAYMYINTWMWLCRISRQMCSSQLWVMWLFHARKSTRFFPAMETKTLWRGEFGPLTHFVKLR